MRPARPAPKNDGAICGFIAIKRAENSNIFSKMRIYDGESLKDTDPHASLSRNTATTPVWMRHDRPVYPFAFKILSRVFNFDNTEVAANPVHLLYVLEQQIEREQFATEMRKNIYLI